MNVNNLPEINVINTVSIGFFGIPNSGKSSLINAMSKKNISIVSNKPQTTQELVDTIFIKDNLQIILLDTPGINYKNVGIRGVVNKVASSAINNSECKFVIVAADKPVVPNINIDFSETYFIITKIDKLSENDLIILTESLHKTYKPREFLFTSIKHPDRIEYLVDFIMQLPSVKKITLSNSTSLSLMEICNLKTKEQLFNLLEKEVPYHCVVDTYDIQEGHRFINAKQNIYVPRVSYRKMILGNDNIKKIRENSQNNISVVIGKRVNLSIQVIIKNIDVHALITDKNISSPIIN